MPILSRSLAIKVSNPKTKLVLTVSFLLLSLPSYCTCQKEVCGTKASEAIDVMWMINTNNDIERSDFLVLKQFLSDMMLWFRISDVIRHGFLVYSETEPEVFKYEVSDEKSQKNFMDFKYENTPDRWLAKALDYLAKNIVTSDRQSVPKVAVVVTAGQTTNTNDSDTNTAATELTRAGWKMIFVFVTSKVDRDKMQKFSSQAQLPNKNYHTVASFRELKSLEFQESFAKAVCGHGDYIDKKRVRMKRNSKIENAYMNVAEGKPANQSSTSNNQGKIYFADLAVDGVPNANFDRGFCSSTNTGSFINWWEVDLTDNYDIEYVSILISIVDALRNRVKYFDVIGHGGNDSAGGLLNNSQICGSNGGTPLGISVRYKCVPFLTQKRYVRIQQTQVHPNNGLVLCQVEVNTAWPPGYYNVAVNKSATQSSIIGNGYADLAIDGNTHAVYIAGSCTLTEGNRQDELEWWRLDLQQTYDIYGVTLFNRRDFYLRMKYLDIFAYEKPERLKPELCGSVTDNIIFSLRHFPCELSQKRYIAIERTQAFPGNFLTFCEVEVWADCEVGTYGRYCEEKCEKCSSACNIDKVTGECLDCEVGTYGRYCEEKCETCSNGCDKVTGECLAGTSAGTSAGAIAGAVVSVLLVLTGIAVGGAFYYKRYYKNKSDSDPDSEEPSTPFKWFWQKKSKKSGGEETEEPAAEEPAAEEPSPSSKWW